MLNIGDNTARQNALVGGEVVAEMDIADILPLDQHVRLADRIGFRVQLLPEERNRSRGVHAGQIFLGHPFPPGRDCEMHMIGFLVARARSIAQLTMREMLCQKRDYPAAELRDLFRIPSLMRRSAEPLLVHGQDAFTQWAMTKGLPRID